MVSLRAALLAFFLVSPSMAAELPGLGAVDRRVPVDVGQDPWRSIGRVQTNLGGRCTGVLIGPRLVLTAAHCLHNDRAGRLLPPSSLHVLFGYRGGDYTVHARILRYTVDPAFDGRRNRSTLAPENAPVDWALLTLDASPAVPALPVAALPTPPGTPLMLGGFSQDRTHRLMADTACRVTAFSAPLFLHDCSATRGTSGGPLLAPRAGGGWEVVGVNVGAGTDNNLAVSSIVLPGAIADAIARDR